MDYLQGSCSPRKSGCYKAQTCSLNFPWIVSKTRAQVWSYFEVFLFKSNNAHTHNQTKPCSFVFYVKSVYWSIEFKLNYIFIDTIKTRGLVQFSLGHTLLNAALIFSQHVLVFAVLWAEVVMTTVMLTSSVQPFHSHFVSVLVLYISIGKYSMSRFPIVSSCFYNSHSVKWVLVSVDQIAICVLLHSCRKYAHCTWWRLTFPLEFWLSYKWLEFLCASSKNGGTCCSFREACY